MRFKYSNNAIVYRRAGFLGLGRVEVDRDVYVPISTSL